MGGDWRWVSGEEGQSVSVSIEGMVQRFQDFESHTVKLRSWVILWQFLILSLICEARIISSILQDCCDH